MADLDLNSVQKAYSRWARVYDLVFGPAMVKARSRGIEMLELSSGQNVLEVGVGTGLTLPLFPPGCHVHGIDISRPMLQRARRRASKPGRNLIEGDVAHMPFREGTFDGVIAPYVVSAVPDPVAMLREIRRVSRPGARIVLLNHFASEHPLLSALERAVAPATSKVLGFHADFDIEPVLHEAGLTVGASERVPPFGYWRALRVEGGAA
jgi:phosphatidylethanolamine/phosphatidyl-N-methylethanolamine N-methyltransferase